MEGGTFHWQAIRGGRIVMHLDLDTGSRTCGVGCWGSEERPGLETMRGVHQCISGNRALGTGSLLGCGSGEGYDLGPTWRDPHFTEYLHSWAM